MGDESRSHTSGGRESWGRPLGAGNSSGRKDSLEMKLVKKSFRDFPLFVKGHYYEAFSERILKLFSQKMFVDMYFHHSK